MTISSTTRKAGPFNGNGVTTSFPFTFKVFAKSDLEVVRTMPSGIEKTLVLNSDYSVALNGDQDANPGGTITYPVSGTPLPTGWRLTAIGTLDNIQPTDITNGGGFYPQVIENALDRVTMLIQQLEEELGRTIRIAVSDDVTDGLDLPATSARADKVLGFNSEGSFRLYDTSVSVTATLYRKFTATAGQTVFTLPQAYTPGVNALYVFRNGSKLISGVDFTETSTTSFTLTSGAAGTDVIEALAGVPQADLPSTDAGLVRYTPAGTGAVARTAQDKLREIVSVKDFGAVGDGVADDTAAIQAAITAVLGSATSSYAVFLPEGIYKLTAPLTVTGSLRIIGEGAAPYSLAVGTRGAGSWLYFAHTGKGISIDGTSTLSGIELERFGAYRDQPTPAASWAPTAHDFDIHIDNADVTLTNMVLLNPTNGVKLTNGSYGRLMINGLRMQAFQIGINVEESYDVVYMDQLHIWPFWKDDANVHAYTRANLDAIKLGRCDNPMLSNIFTIFASRGLRLYQATAGKTSKLHLVNADFDRGNTGILVDANGANGQITNVTIQGETGAAGSRGIVFEGTNNRFEITNLDVNEVDQQAIGMATGTGHEARVTNLIATNYNKSANSFPAVEAASGNTVRIAEVPKISGGGNGVFFGGAGKIVSPLAEGTSGVSTDASGDVVVTHGGGIKPNRVFVQLRAFSPLFWAVRDITSTTFTVRFWTSAGAAFTSTSVGFDWKAEF